MILRFGVNFSSLRIVFFFFFLYRLSLFSEIKQVMRFVVGSRVDQQFTRRK